MSRRAAFERPPRDPERVPVKRKVLAWVIAGMMLASALTAIVLALQGN